MKHLWGLCYSNYRPGLFSAVFGHSQLVGTHEWKKVIQLTKNISAQELKYHSCYKGYIAHQGDISKLTGTTTLIFFENALSYISSGFKARWCWSWNLVCVTQPMIRQWNKLKKKNPMYGRPLIPLTCTYDSTNEKIIVYSKRRRRR